mmetsp:Transcript_29382/g.75948  ORF Transcript_29382/g.75948 Transcript_29382/m.75948 type:complete len:334 (+) Transcript_29382:462-1463(+)
MAPQAALRSVLPSSLPVSNAQRLRSSCAVALRSPLSATCRRRCVARGGLRCPGQAPVAPVAAASSPRDDPKPVTRGDVVPRAAAEEVLPVLDAEVDQTNAAPESPLEQQLRLEREERKERRRREQMTYQVSAIAASCLLTSTAIVATWCRFTMHADGAIPAAEFLCTLLLIVGGTVGMEMYARYAHRILWHDFQPGWALHKSHHEPRMGAFELNDIYAVANAVPAMSLCAYGFLTPGIIGGVCFGLGLGITIFGISYMFVHDGMVHKRFPVGPIAELPYLKRVAVAHRVHHSERYEGVPYGLFLGPQELEAVGGGEYLDQLVEQLDMSSPTTR